MMNDLWVAIGQSKVRLNPDAQVDPVVAIFTIDPLPATVQHRDCDYIQ